MKGWDREKMRKLFILLSLLCTYTLSSIAQTSSPQQTPKPPDAQTQNKKTSPNEAKHAGSPTCGKLRAVVYTLAVADTDSPGPNFARTDQTFDLSNPVSVKPLVDNAYNSNGHGGGTVDLFGDCDTSLGDDTTIVRFSAHETAKCGQCAGCGQGPGGGTGFYPVWTQTFEGTHPKIDVKMEMNEAFLAERSCKLTIDGGFDPKTSFDLKLTDVTSINPHLDEGRHELRIECSTSSSDRQHIAYWLCRAPNAPPRDMWEKVTVRTRTGD